MAWKIQCQLELDDNLWITQKANYNWMTAYELVNKFVNGLKDSMPTRIGWQFMNHPKGPPKGFDIFKAN